MSFAVAAESVNDSTGKPAAVVDQSFDPSGNINLAAGFGGLNTNQEIAQTFKVGKTGLLTEVDISVGHPVGSPLGGYLTFELRHVAASGAPSNTTDLLFQRAIPSTAFSMAETFVPINVSSAGLRVNAGDRLAIVVYAESGTPSDVAYQWYGQFNSVYPNGANWEQETDNDNWIPSSGDLGFRTFVTTGVASAPFAVTVNLSGASSANTTIPFSLGGTAISGTDYLGVTPSPLVIPAGKTSAIITGILIDQGAVGVNKTLAFGLGPPSNGQLGTITTNTLTIQNPTPAPSVAFATTSQSVAENAGSFSIPVNLSAASNVDTTISFTLGGTAVVGSDYTVNGNSITIPAGQTTGAITGSLINDYALDGPQTLTFTLGTPTNATLGSVTTNTLFIAETPPRATITYKSGYASLTEPAPGNTAPYYFTIALNDISPEPVTVYYQTRNGTAQAGEDYRGVNNYRVTFPAFAHGAPPIRRRRRI